MDSYNYYMSDKIAKKNSYHFFVYEKMANPNFKSGIENMSNIAEEWRNVNSNSRQKYQNCAIRYNEYIKKYITENPNWYLNGNKDEIMLEANMYALNSTNDENIEEWLNIRYIIKSIKNLQIV